MKIKNVLLCVLIILQINLFSQDIYGYKIFKGHSDKIVCGNISPNGKYLVTGSWDNTIKIWDIENELEIRTINAHEEYVNKVCFSPDGNAVMSCSKDSTIKIFNIADGKLLKTFKNSDKVLSVSYAPDQKSIISSDNNEIKIWDILSGAVVRKMEFHSALELNLCISPCGKYIAAYDFGEITIFNFNTGKVYNKLILVKDEYNGTATDMRFSSDGKYLLASYYKGAVVIWDVNIGKIFKKFNSKQNPAYSVCFSPDGNSFLVARLDDVSIRDLLTNKIIHDFTNDFYVSEYVEYSKDGRLILFCYYNVAIIKKL